MRILRTNGSSLLTLNLARTLPLTHDQTLLTLGCAFVFVKYVIRRYKMIRQL